jgi:hypothetical protein
MKWIKLFENFNDLIKSCGSYKNILTSYDSYDFFLRTYNYISFNNKKKFVKKFIESKDYIFNFKYSDLTLKNHLLIQKRLY